MSQGTTLVVPQTGLLSGSYLADFSPRDTCFSLFSETFLACRRYGIHDCGLGSLNLV